MKDPFPFSGPYVERPYVPWRPRVRSLTDRTSQYDEVPVNNTRCTGRIPTQDSIAIQLLPEIDAPLYTEAGDQLSVLCIDRIIVVPRSCIRTSLEKHSGFLESGVRSTHPGSSYISSGRIRWWRQIEVLRRSLGHGLLGKRHIRRVGQLSLCNSGTFSRATP